MASAPKYSIFIAFVGLLLLFSSMNEARIGITEICEKPSQTWSGMCGNTGHCDKQCKEWEHASHGACHLRLGLRCYCYFETCS